MKNLDQKGQALIELIVFLPIMFMFYSMIAGFANAINGSINQQKIARAYFYYKVQNNSTIPKPDGDTYKNWRTFGMFFIGWKDYFVDQKPVAPCYQLTIPLKASSSDKCEEKYSSDSTLFIRVQTAYGVCGGTYANLGNAIHAIPDYPGANFTELVSRGSCVIAGR